MFCEIYVKHHPAVPPADLVTALRSANLGAEIKTADAHARSVLYRAAGAAVSLFAHETVRNCFVILRSVNLDTSTFHLEGNAPTVSIETLLEATQEYVVSHLLPTLRRNPSSSARLQAVKLFEDNGRETGLEGRLPGLSSAFTEQLDWSEIHSHVIVLLVAFTSLALGVPSEKLKDAEIALAVTVLYAIVNGLLKYAWRRNKLKFGFKES
jgi:hypothetical protein